MKTQSLTPAIPILLLAGTLFLRSVAAGDPASEKVAYLGVSVAPLEDTLRYHLNLPRGAGLKVLSVVADSPAEAAGLKKHDVLEKINEQVLFNSEQFAALIRSFKPAESITLSVIRAGQAEAVTATLGETNLPESAEIDTDLPTSFLNPFDKKSDLRMLLRELQEKPDRTGPFFDLNRALMSHSKPVVFLGVEAKPVDASLVAQLGLENDHGVLVGHVVQDSPAEEAGLRQHDLIFQLNGSPVTDPEEFARCIREHKAGDTITLKVLRAGQEQEVEATLAESPGPEPRHLQRILEEYRIVPKVEIVPSSNAAGTSVMILEGATGGGGAAAMGTSQSGGKPKHQTVVVHSTTQSHSSPAPSTNIRQNRAVITIQSDDGTITIQEENGDRRAVVTDAENEVLFDGKINTEEEKTKLPAEARKHIEAIEKDLQLKQAAPKEVHEIQIPKPKKEPGVVRVLEWTGPDVS